MRYYVYSLHFLTPVHFGNTAEGGTLENVELSFSSDSFFSALCNEAAQAPELLQTLLAAVEQGKMVLSSLFPFFDREKETGQWEYYLPRPLRLENKKLETHSYQATKAEATRRKALKQVRYVRASLLEKKDSEKTETAILEQPNFGQFETVAKLNRRLEPGLPYFIGSYTFAPGAGLYFLAGFEEGQESLEDQFDQLLELLGYSGIGGERSSGCGKFELAADKEEMDPAYPCLFEDTQALLDMLIEQQGDYYMTIAALVPDQKTISQLAEGTYKLRKRSGFVSSAQLANAVKRNSYYTLVEGSCFPQPLTGRMLQFQVPGLAHPVYRNGLGLFVGVHDA